MTIIKAKHGGVTVHYASGDVLSLEDLPSRALALDGVVRGPQAADTQDRWSLDHHEDCLRLITRATCEQVHACLCLGGAGWAKDRDVFVNDIDGDTLLSLWLLCNPWMANEPTVRDLVRAVGAIDAHGPAGSLMLSPFENTLATAYFRRAIKPITDLRGKVREVFETWPALVDDALEGIDQLSRDQVAILSPEKVEVIVHAALCVHGYQVALASSEGFAFSELYARGFDAAVAYNPAADNSVTYTVAKRSDLVDLPVKTLLDRLNEREPGWGGGSSIGGSPRLPGGVSSRLTPAEVWLALKAVFE